MTQPSIRRKKKKPNSKFRGGGVTQGDSGVQREINLDWRDDEKEQNEVVTR